MSPEVSIFTTHPGQSLAAGGALGKSPGYWVGNGRHPDAAQDHNVVLLIYNRPDRRGFEPEPPRELSHAYFPKALMEESSVDGHMAFGRIGEAWVALVGAHPLGYAEGSGDDLVQEGLPAAWVCELGSPETDVSYEAFKRRVTGQPFEFDAGQLRVSWGAGSRHMELEWGGEFRVGGEVVETSYDRFDSPWSRTSRKPTSVLIEAGGHALEMSFEPLRRIER
jgi:hypothetical protein